MSKLIIIGTIEVESGKREQVMRTLLAHKARCLKYEPGTLQFELMIPREDDSRIFIYEAYRDDGAFELHRSAPSIAQFREDTAGMGVKVVANRCTPVA